VAAAVGKPMINWSIDTLDWKSKNAASVQSKVLDNVKDGDIVLMHDLYKSTADACDVIIPELVKRGYQLVTVSELAAAKGVTLQNGTLYNSMR
jgi:peptidoglycan/xylan/chitin deacetylase (PgdA/CDA1 family)